MTVPHHTPEPQEIYQGYRPVSLAAVTRPTLLVVVDTEEEFPWEQSLSRERTSVSHLRHIDRFQSLFERFGISPTYVVDFPVASQPIGYEPLRALAVAGRCSIGTHIHPWVTPPFDERVSGYNSFIGNLRLPTQRAKIEATTAAIETNIGVRPRTFKAGRYGIGRDTALLIEELGYDIDQSVMPHFDYSTERGPSFTRFDARPFTFGSRRPLLGLPATAAYLGAAGRFAPAVYDAAASPLLTRLHGAGIVSRLRLADRLNLSPEGYTAAEMIRVATHQVKQGVPVLTMTLHSPSVEPGHTPYVRTAQDLETFVGTMTTFLEHFYTKLSGTSTTPEALRQLLLARPEPMAAPQGHPR